MTDTPSIRTTASATARARSDRWELDISVAATSAQPGDASRRRALAVATAQRVLAGHPGTVIDREQVEMGRSYEGDSATARWRARFSGGTGELEALREVVSRLAGVPDLVVTGPTWLLSPELAEQTRLRALAMATTTARTRAEQIATALGGRLATLLQASDGGADTGSGEARMYSAIPAVGLAELPPRTLDLDLNPDECEVGVQVSLSFGFRA